jgi:hypothetical protein
MEFGIATSPVSFPPLCWVLPRFDNQDTLLCITVHAIVTRVESPESSQSRVTTPPILELRRTRNQSGEAGKKQRSPHETTSVPRRTGNRSLRVEPARSVMMLVGRCLVVRPSEFGSPRRDGAVPEERPSPQAAAHAEVVRARIMLAAADGGELERGLYRRRDQGSLRLGCQR